MLGPGCSGLKADDDFDENVKPRSSDIKKKAKFKD